MGLGGAFVPLGERAFRLLWLGRMASAVGDALVPVALAFAVISVDHSSTALGVVLAAFWIARVVFTLAGGIVADRFPRRAVMLTCDGVRAIIEAFTATMLFTHQMTVPLFIVTGALFGIASAFFGPAADGLVPQTVSPRNLQSANALLATSRNATSVIGPLVSGALIGFAGTGWVFAIDAVTFLVSGFFLLQVNVSAHLRVAQKHFVHELRDGFHEVTSRSWVSASIVAFGIANFCLASFIVLGPVIFKDQLGGARNWGIVSACGAAGAIVGSLAAARFRPRRPLSTGFLATALIAAPMLALAGPSSTSAIAVTWFLGFGAIIFSNVYWETALQQRIPEHVYSRVRSYDILVSFVFMPIGFIVFGPLAHAIGDGKTLVAAAVVTALTAVTVALVPGVRGVRDETREPASAELKQVPA